MTVSTETAAANAGKLDNNFDKDDVFKELHLQVNVTKEFKDNAYNQIDSYIDEKQAAARENLKKAMASNDATARDEALNDIYKLQYQRRYLETLVGVVAGSPGVAITQGTLATAATAMREETVRNSFLSPSITDVQGNIVSNTSGESNGLYDGIKAGGVRMSLDIFCKSDNSRCARDEQNPQVLTRDNQGNYGYVGDEEHPTIPSLMDDKSISDPLYGATGGFQGTGGELAPFGSYTVGTFWGDFGDKIVESYAGTHDFIGGELPGFYDNEGNTSRGRGTISNIAANTWTVAAIPLATPFAVSEMVSPELLQFIFSAH